MITSPLARPASADVQLTAGVAAAGIGDPERYFTHVARRSQALGHMPIPELPPEVRLALEMSAHEDSERRAMEGELAALREEWESAEEIAAIADDMFVPAAVRGWMDRVRGGAGHR